MTFKVTIGKFGEDDSADIKVDGRVVGWLERVKDERFTSASSRARVSFVSHYTIMLTDDAADAQLRKHDIDARADAKLEVARAFERAWEKLAAEPGRLCCGCSKRLTVAEIEACVPDHDEYCAACRKPDPAIAEPDAKNGCVYFGCITPILGERCRDRVLARLVDDNTGSDIKRELEAVMLEVSRTFKTMSKANAKFNRCSKPDSREAARVAIVAAEAEYRQVADRRDRLVELRNAQQTQRGGQPTISHDGRAVFQTTQSRIAIAKRKLSPRQRSKL